jgi:hypothetical protein
MRSMGWHGTWKRAMLRARFAMDDALTVNIMSWDPESHPLRRPQPRR